MKASDVCPICQGALAASASEGLCPKCLWASLLEPDADSAEMERKASAFLLAATEEAPGRLADYELLDEIARGGMGVIFRARQISLQRVVALKMIRTARLPGEADMKRFRAEAEAVARLEHPNIVPIYEVGDDDGHPYFTMKFIPGGSLAERILDFGLANWDSADAEAPAAKSEIQNRQAKIAKLLAKVARAVHHAHQRGILHRDLKPSNILLDERDEPLVSDFGLAKQIETESTLTLSGAVLGTPAYIAPEQAAGGKSLTTAVDVYSLGAILYELMTGRPPFQADTPLETLRQVVEQEPRRPSSIHSRVDRDLETICLKCLQKNPAPRYRSAEALAEDLERWLRGEPIHARRTSALERSVKWTRRHPASAALLLLAVITPLVMISLLLITNARVHRAGFQARENLYAADMFLADRALREGNLGLARSALAAHIPAPEQSGGPDDFRGFEWRLLWGHSQGDHLQVLRLPHAPTALAVSPDGRTLAIGGQDFLWRWNVDEPAATQLLPPKEPRWLDPEAAAKVLAKVRMTPVLSNQFPNMNPTPGQISQMVNPERLDTVTGLSFSPDGRSVVTSTRTEGRAVRVWSLSDGAIEFAFPAVFSSALMSPAAPILAVSSYAKPYDVLIGAVKLYHLEQRAEIWALPDAGGMVNFSENGQLMITAGWDAGARTNRVKLWSLPERRQLQAFASKTSWNAFALSPNGGWLASVPAHGSVIELWSVEQGRLVRELAGHSGAIRTLAFSPDSQWLASAGGDQNIRLWSIPSGEQSETRIGHTDEIAQVAFFPDGQRLASASRDGTVRVWSATPSKREALLYNWDRVYEEIVISSDGRWWADRGSRRVCETRPGSSSRLTQPDRDDAHNEGFDDGGRTMISSVYRAAGAKIDLEWRSLDDQSVTRRLSLGGDVESGHIWSRALRAGAALFAIGQADGLVRVWSTDTGAEICAFRLPNLQADEPVFINQISRLAISPDGALLAASPASCSMIGVFSIPDNKLLFSRHARQLITVMPGRRRDDPGDLVFLAFSPDSKLLVTTDAKEPGIRLWEARTGRAVGHLSGHRNHTVAVAFSPDGRTLASTGAEGSVKLWHFPTRREVATLMETGATGPVAFSPDGSLLLVALVEHVRAFRAPSLAEIDRQPD